MPPTTRTTVSHIEPGSYVRHPQRSDWGVGQVQSVIGTRVTVNFAHAGKILVNAAVVGLELADPLPADPDDAPFTTPWPTR